ncbi:MAG: hypothetical protein LRY75_20565 [Shewanella xiamenensis]|uniref:hypothetical protein n=1 Tax=Shewanella TaxID=22 RepID=UPI0021C242AE|nr:MULTISPECIES: hypothetical protein [Shewanella]MCD8548923.1 hypothetical protein [Shewanella xiamenensis]MCD8561149.1 hypothetical protein [Shewanella xiamenensis]MCT8869475.1 hypothetical protein [Shewanella xiamenensis]MCU8063409.1 hypothetical protein [Shewanella sp. SM55]MEE1982246.1 hypothetical protein [Shewanella xiamenensis]
MRYATAIFGSMALAMFVVIILSMIVERQPHNFNPVMLALSIMLPVCAPALVIIAKYTYPRFGTWVTADLTMVEDTPPKRSRRAKHRK